MTKDLSPEELAAFKEKYGLVSQGDAEPAEIIEVPDYRTELSEYKGNPTIAIFIGDKRVMGFGLKKAVAIEACMDDIKKFIDSAGK